MPEETPSVQPKQPELFSAHPEPKKEEPVKKTELKPNSQPSQQSWDPKPEPKPKIETQKKGESLIVRSELNLEHFSVFTVSTYRKKSREIVVREKLPTGEVSERRAIIGKTAKGIETGVLDIHHFKVYLVLLELWEKAGRPIHEPVHFTILRVIKRLDLSFDGRTYARVKQWLRDLRQVPLTFINSFYIPKVERHTDLHDVSVLNHLRIYERKKEKEGEQQKTYGYGEFRFDDYILENLVNNYSHPLRLDVIKEFKKHKDLAILLYTYLDRCLAFRDEYAVTLEKLFEHLDLSQRYVRYPAERKRVITPVLKELKNKELSTGILTECEIKETEDGKDYKLVARKDPYPALPQIRSETPSRPEPQIAEAISEGPIAQLRAKGLWESQIREVFALWGKEAKEMIERQLELLPFRVKWYHFKGVRVNSEAAILYMSLKGNWPPPPNYLEFKAEEARTKRYREEAEQRRKEEAERERERQEWLKLSAEEKAERSLIRCIIGYQVARRNFREEPSEEWKTECLKRLSQYFKEHPEGSIPSYQELFPEDSKGMRL